MDYTKQIEYYYSGEFATKSPEVLTDENKSQVEIYDCHAGKSLDVSQRSIDELAEVLSEIAANGRKISEEEYDKIINS